MDKDLIKQAAKNLELLEIALVEQSLETARDRYMFGRLHAESIGQQTFVSTEAALTEYRSNEQELETVVVDVSLGLRIYESDADEEDIEGDIEDDNLIEDKVLGEIRAVYRVEYGVIGEQPPQNAINEFASHNAVHNVYPFWRELVFSIARKSRWPAVFVPLYRNAGSGETMNAPDTTGFAQSGLLPKRRSRRKSSRKAKKS